MEILWVNYACSNHGKQNVLIVEKRKRIGIDQIASLKSFLISLFRGRWILRHVVDVRKEKDRVIIHVRGNRREMDDILGELSRNFALRQRSLVLSELGYFMNAPYKKRRNPQQSIAYGEKLNRILPMLKNIFK